MKKKLLMTVLSGMMVTGMLLTGCGKNVDEVNNNVNNTEMTEMQQADMSVNTETGNVETEVVHTHTYMEDIVAATCETEGVKTFTCECGDSYTKNIAAIGHIFENYIYNEDATYLADGTETAVCNNCEATDTRTVADTKLEYTYSDMAATKYAKQSVNVRNLPTKDGERLGGLSMNQAVTITGQCNETKWYRIEFNGGVGYVSSNYVVDEMIVEEPEEEIVETPVYTAPVDVTVETSVETTVENTTTSNETTANNENPYPLYQVIDEGGNNVYFYWLWDGVSADKGAEYTTCYNACRAILQERNPGKNGGGANGVETGYYVNGMQVVKAEPIIF